MSTTVLFVATGLGIGGAETLLLTVAKELQDRGFTVIVASLLSDNPLTSRFRDAGLDVIELDANPSRLPVSAVLKLRKIIRDRKVDFIQGWMYHGNLVAFAATVVSGLKPKRQTGFGIFGVWPDMKTYGRVTGLVAKLGGYLSSRIQAVVYNAETAARDHEARGYTASNSMAIGNCIDIAQFTRDPAAALAVREELGLGSEDVVAIIAARNHPQKDWPTMLEALSGVDGLRVLAVGHQTQNLLDHPRLQKLGPRSDMAALYSASDFFVLTSAFGEGTSLGMSEAMSCSLPVIVTDIGDNARFATKAGFTVGVGDIAGLREAAQRLTNDEPLRQEMSKQARSLAEQAFSTSQNVEPLIPIFDNNSSSSKPRNASEK